MATDEPSDQDYQWGRHAARYGDLFLDPFQPGVLNPLFKALDGVPNPGALTVADLGCGTGPLLPRLVGRFGKVIALDFAPEMIEQAQARLGADADRVVFETRQMEDLEGYTEKIDVAVAVNSLVMPDVRVIDRTLSAIRKSLRKDGVLIGVVPSIDAIYYQTMLLYDQALARGLTVAEAKRHAVFYAEHRYYNFAFGTFRYRGLHQKFWQPFEIRHHLRKAGFRTYELDQVLYPWDENMVGGGEFKDHPRSWDWMFAARP